MLTRCNYLFKLHFTDAFYMHSFNFLTTSGVFSSLSIECYITRIFNFIWYFYRHLPHHHQFSHFNLLFLPSSEHWPHLHSHHLPTSILIITIVVIITDDKMCNYPCIKDDNRCDCKWYGKFNYVYILLWNYFWFDSLSCKKIKISFFNINNIYFYLAFLYLKLITESIIFNWYL